MKKIIIGVLALAVVLGVLFWKFAPNFFGPKQEVEKDITLTVYGLWEKTNDIQPAIDSYQKDHPHIKIDYQVQKSTNYRTRVQTKIANNEGPDVFMIHNTWLPMFLKPGLVVAMPTAIMNFNDFSKAFYPVVKDTLSMGNQVYALPRGIDGLALYYNTDILEGAGLAVPTTWDDLVREAAEVTVIDDKDKIQTAGLSIGTTNNVDHWSDILGLLFLQNPGASLEDPTTEQSAEVLQFYTDLVTGRITSGKRVWDKTMPASTDAFAQNRLAFYIGPSWRASELRVINPKLKFGIAPMPQLPGRSVGWATFWAYAVSSHSANAVQAWDFVKFLTSAETQKQLYQVASQERLFGLPYSRVELQKELGSDPLVGPFVNQGAIYKSWYLSSQTFDQNGINEATIKYYEDAVNSVNGGADPKAALETVKKGVSQVLNEYKQESVTTQGP